MREDREREGRKEGERERKWAGKEGRKEGRKERGREGKKERRRGLATMYASSRCHANILVVASDRTCAFFLKCFLLTFLLKRYFNTDLALQERTVHTKQRPLNVTQYKQNQNNRSHKTRVIYVRRIFRTREDFGQTGLGLDSPLYLSLWT